MHVAVAATAAVVKVAVAVAAAEVAVVVEVAAAEAAAETAHCYYCCVRFVL